MSPPKKLDVFADSPVALSGFQGQVKKPEISGFGPLCRSHLKSLRLTGYETCRWPDRGSSTKSKISDLPHVLLCVVYAFCILVN